MKFNKTSIKIIGLCVLCVLAVILPLLFNFCYKKNKENFILNTQPDIILDSTSNLIFKIDGNSDFPLISWNSFLPNGSTTIVNNLNNGTTITNINYVSLTNNNLVSQNNNLNIDLINEINFILRFRLKSFENKTFFFEISNENNNVKQNLNNLNYINLYISRNSILLKIKNKSINSNEIVFTLNIQNQILLDNVWTVLQIKLQPNITTIGGTREDEETTYNYILKVFKNGVSIGSTSLNLPYSTYGINQFKKICKMNFQTMNFGIYTTSTSPNIDISNIYIINQTGTISQYTDIFNDLQRDGILNFSKTAITTNDTQCKLENDNCKSISGYDNNSCKKLFKCNDTDCQPVCKPVTYIEPQTPIYPCLRRINIRDPEFPSQTIKQYLPNHFSKNVNTVLSTVLGSILKISDMKSNSITELNTLMWKDGHIKINDTNVFKTSSRHIYLGGDDYINKDDIYTRIGLQNVNFKTINKPYSSSINAVLNYKGDLYLCDNYFQTLWKTGDPILSSTITKPITPILKKNKKITINRTNNCVKIDTLSADDGKMELFTEEKPNQFRLFFNLELPYQLVFPLTWNNVSMYFYFNIYFLIIQYEESGKTIQRSLTNLEDIQKSMILNTENLSLILTDYGDVVIVDDYNNILWCFSKYEFDIENCPIIDPKIVIPTDIPNSSYYTINSICYLNKYNINYNKDNMKNWGDFVISDLSKNILFTDYCIVSNLKCAKEPFSLDSFSIVITFNISTGTKTTEESIFKIYNTDKNLQTNLNLLLNTQNKIFLNIQPTLKYSINLNTWYKFIIKGLYDISTKKQKIDTKLLLLNDYMINNIEPDNNSSNKELFEIAYDSNHKFNEIILCTGNHTVMLYDFYIFDNYIGNKVDFNFKNICPTFPSIDLKIALKGARTNNYLSYDPTSKSIAFTSSTIGNNEIFNMTTNSDGTISLSPYNFSNQYCGIENNITICNRSVIGPWEKFILKKEGESINGNEIVSLLNTAIKRYCADDSTRQGDSIMNCNRLNINEWEKFELIKIYIPTIKFYSVENIADNTSYQYDKSFNSKMLFKFNTTQFTNIQKSICIFNISNIFIMSIVKKEASPEYYIKIYINTNTIDLNTKLIPDTEYQSNIIYYKNDLINIFINQILIYSSKINYSSIPQNILISPRISIVTPSNIPYVYLPNLNYIILNNIDSPTLSDITFGNETQKIYNIDIWFNFKGIYFNTTSKIPISFIENTQESYVQLSKDFYLKNLSTKHYCFDFRKGMTCMFDIKLIVQDIKYWVDDKKIHLFEFKNSLNNDTFMFYLLKKSDSFFLILKIGEEEITSSFNGININYWTSVGFILDNINSKIYFYINNISCSKKYNQNLYYKMYDICNIGNVNDMPYYTICCIKKMFLTNNITINFSDYKEKEETVNIRQFGYYTQNDSMFPEEIRYSSKNFIVRGPDVDNVSICLSGDDGIISLYSLIGNYRGLNNLCFRNSEQYVSTVSVGSIFYGIYSFYKSSNNACSTKYKHEYIEDNLLGTSCEINGNIFLNKITSDQLKNTNDTILDGFLSFKNVLDTYIFEDSFTWNNIVGNLFLEKFNLNRDIPILLNSCHLYNFRIRNPSFNDAYYLPFYNPFWLCNSSIESIFEDNPIYNIPFTFTPLYYGSIVDTVKNILIPGVPTTPITTPTSVSGELDTNVVIKFADEYYISELTSDFNNTNYTFKTKIQYDSITYTINISSNDIFECDEGINIYNNFHFGKVFNETVFFNSVNTERLDPNLFIDTTTVNEKAPKIQSLNTLKNIISTSSFIQLQNSFLDIFKVQNMFNINGNKNYYNFIYQKVDPRDNFTNNIYNFNNGKKSDPLGIIPLLVRKVQKIVCFTTIGSNIEFRMPGTFITGIKGNDFIDPYFNDEIYKVFVELNNEKIRIYNQLYISSKNETACYARINLYVNRNDLLNLEPYKVDILIIVLTHNKVLSDNPVIKNIIFENNNNTFPYELKSIGNFFEKPELSKYSYYDSEKYNLLTTYTDWCVRKLKYTLDDMYLNSSYNEPDIAFDILDFLTYKIYTKNGIFLNKTGNISPKICDIRINEAEILNTFGEIKEGEEGINNLPSIYYKKDKNPIGILYNIDKLLTTYSYNVFMIIKIPTQDIKTDTIFFEIKSTTTPGYLYSDSEPYFRFKVNKNLNKIILQLNAITDFGVIENEYKGITSSKEIELPFIPNTPLLLFGNYTNNKLQIISYYVYNDITYMSQISSEDFMSYCFKAKKRDVNFCNTLLDIYISEISIYNGNIDIQTQNNILKHLLQKWNFKNIIKNSSLIHYCPKKMSRIGNNIFLNNLASTNNDLQVEYSLEPTNNKFLGSNSVFGTISLDSTIKINTNIECKDGFVVIFVLNIIQGTGNILNFKNYSLYSEMISGVQNIRLKYNNISTDRINLQNFNIIVCEGTKDQIKLRVFNNNVETSYMKMINNQSLIQSKIMIGEIGLIFQIKEFLFYNYILDEISIFNIMSILDTKYLLNTTLPLPIFSNLRNKLIANFVYDQSNTFTNSSNFSNWKSNINNIVLVGNNSIVEKVKDTSILPINVKSLPGILISSGSSMKTDKFTIDGYNTTVAIVIQFNEYKCDELCSIFDIRPFPNNKTILNLLNGSKYDIGIDNGSDYRETLFLKTEHQKDDGSSNLPKIEYVPMIIICRINDNTLYFEQISTTNKVPTKKKINVQKIMNYIPKTAEISIGGGKSNFILSEMLVYNRSLYDYEIPLIREYLANKWEFYN